MTASATVDPATGGAVAASAVAWINGRTAMVAEMSRAGRVSTCEVSRGWLTQDAYLSQVVRVIGDRDRLLILGPSSLRTSLERAYASTFRRSDRLIDVEPAARMTAEELVVQLRELAG